MRNKVCEAVKVTGLKKLSPEAWYGEKVKKQQSDYLTKEQGYVTELLKNVMSTVYYGESDVNSGKLSHFNGKDCLVCFSVSTNRDR